jgi:hypothetical protein
MAGRKPALDGKRDAIMRVRLLAIYLLHLAIALASAARAEVFVLKSGGRLEGEILNPNRERGQPYQVKTDDGAKLALADSAVSRVIAKTDLDRQYEALLPKLEKTVESQWTMAEWCKEAGLTEQRKRHLQAVLVLDPNHAEARRALGYQKHGSKWLTQDEFMQSVGYVRYKGTWRTRQEIDIDSRETQQELAAKKLRKDIYLWIEQVGTGGRMRDAAEKNLNAIQDPSAVTSLAEIIGDAQQPRAVRKKCLEILAKLPSGPAIGTLVRVAMNDSDDGIREACLDEMKRQGTHSVLSAFVSELKSKDNARVNRAGDCLGYLKDKDATLPLINALVTTHQFAIQQGGPPGSMTNTFSPSGGGGGMSMGNKTTVIKKQLQNAGVRGALSRLYPDAGNLQYDIDAWRAWYATTQSTANVDLRRGE